MSAGIQTGCRKRAVRRAVATISILAAFCTTARAEYGCSPESAADLSALVDEMAMVPEGSWVRANRNSIADVFSPSELRPSAGALRSTPEKIIRAWSGFAWDCRRGDLMIFGGGHANYPGNDTYRWRATTRRWERMSLPSDVERFLDTAVYTAIDGAFAAPVGAHTYDNNIYLPTVDRFLVLGGSLWNTGGPFETPAGPNATRVTGPYVFDPAKADPDKVGGTTGSHVQTAGLFPDIVGGMMWQNRDLYEILPLDTLPMNFTGGTTAYAIPEEGRDVVYLSARPSRFTTQQSLYRYELSSPDDALSDVVTLVGVNGGGVSGRGAGAYDPHLNVFVRTGKSSPRYEINDGTFAYWDLSTPGPANRSVPFQPVDLSGGWVLDRGYGLDYDPIRRQYVLWGGDRDVWILKAPAALSATGWSIERARGPAGTDGPVYPYEGATIEPGGGVLGKWKYIPELDAFMGLEGPEEGNVWLYKPVGWVRPGSPLPPVIALLADPDEVTSGQVTTLTWSVADASTCAASGGWSGSRPTEGTAVVGPVVQTSQFVLTCTGPGGESSREVTVRVVPPVTFTASPAQVVPGASTTLDWSADWAAGCEASGGWTGPRPTTGSEVSSAIYAATSFSLTCSDASGASVSRTVLVDIAAPPKISLTGDPMSLAAGMTSTLRWSASNATSCTASRGWSGLRPTSGTETVGPINVSTRYDLTCTGPGGSTTAKLLIRRTW